MKMESHLDITMGFNIEVNVMEINIITCYQDAGQNYKSFENFNRVQIDT
jgi:hypothetical protein